MKDSNELTEISKAKVQNEKENIYNKLYNTVK